MSYSRVGVVTGANKGIGLAIVRQLALQYPKSPLDDGSFLIYLTARDNGRGESAVKILQDDHHLKEAQALVSYGGSSEIKFHTLDVGSSSSIQCFADHLKQFHAEGVDFVINNAAIAMDGFDSNVVQNTLSINYYGTLEASHTFLPLIKTGGRLINVASVAGKLSGYSDDLRNRFLNSKNESDITKLMEEFATAVEAGNQEKQGWPSAAYSVSKAGLIGATRALAADERQKGGTVLINSCCPGYVNTDMTKGRGSKTPDAGAQTPVFLALQDLKGRSGLFWKDEEPQAWS